MIDLPGGIQMFQIRRGLLGNGIGTDDQLILRPRAVVANGFNRPAREVRKIFIGENADRDFGHDGFAATIPT
jgi:hypothetical protein